MNDKTEILDVNLIKKESAKKPKKRKKKAGKGLGIYKYFIAIGGVAIAAIIFLTVWFYNTRGGLVSMSLDEYLNDTKKMQERTVVYIGGDDDISKELTSVLQDLAKKNGKQYYYLDVGKITKADDVQNIQNRFVATQTGYVVPMVLVIEKGELVDERTDKNTGVPTGMMQGYLDRDTLIQFLKDNKVY